MTLDEFATTHLDRRDSLALRKLQGDALTADESAELAALNSMLDEVIPHPIPPPADVLAAMAEAERLLALYPKDKP